MTASFVADPSIAVAWVHPAHDETDRGDPRRHRRRRHPRSATTLALEVANALIVPVRRRKLTDDERKTGLGRLGGLRLRVDQEMASLGWSRLSDLSETYQLSLYDAAYLELAIRKGLALATRDAPLNDAAQLCGVKTLL